MSDVKAVAVVATDHSRLLARIIRTLIHDYYSMRTRMLPPEDYDKQLGDLIKAKLWHGYNRGYLPGRHMRIDVTSNHNSVDVDFKAWGDPGGNEVNIKIHEPFGNGLDPRFFDSVKEDWTADGFLHDLILFAKGQYGRWTDFDGLVEIYMHHYATLTPPKITERNFFYIYPVIERALSEIGERLNPHEHMDMLRHLSQRDFEAAIGVNISHLTLMPVGRVNDVQMMWKPNPVIAEKLAPFVNREP